MLESAGLIASLSRLEYDTHLLNKSPVFCAVSEVEISMPIQLKGFIMVTSVL